MSAIREVKFLFEVRVEELEDEVQVRLVAEHVQELWADVSSAVFLLGEGSKETDHRARALQIKVGQFKDGLDMSAIREGSGSTCC
jgi:hypothetical protein